MKEKYVEPEVRIIVLPNMTDIVTSSGGLKDNGNYDDSGTNYGDLWWF